VYKGGAVGQFGIVLLYQLFEMRARDRAPGFSPSIAQI
jgi:hypothetical protein